MNATKPIRAGVVGWPIAHSLSPLIHTYWLNKYGIAGEYTAIPVSPEAFKDFARSARERGLAGVNVTIPHKEAAYALSDTLDEDARAAGAVNVLIFEDEKIHGRNTDVSGFGAALREALGADAASRGPVVMLGAGGAARAVLRALLKEGARDIRILNRTRGRAEILRDVFAEALAGSGQLSVCDWGDWQNAFAGAALLINTTSLGMKGKDPLEVPLDALPQSAALADIVYNPLETELLKHARARGLKTMDGLGMLMHQAAPAFAAWFGVMPEVTPELRALLEEKLHG